MSGSLPSANITTYEFKNDKILVSLIMNRGSRHDVVSAWGRERVVQPDFAVITIRHDARDRGGGIVSCSLSPHEMPLAMWQHLLTTTTTTQVETHTNENVHLFGLVNHENKSYFRAKIAVAPDDFARQDVEAWFPADVLRSPLCAAIECAGKLGLVFADRCNLVMRVGDDSADPIPSQPEND